MAGHRPLFLQRRFPDEWSLAVNWQVIAGQVASHEQVADRRTSHDANVFIIYFFKDQHEKLLWLSCALEMRCSCGAMRRRRDATGAARGATVATARSPQLHNAPRSSSVDRLLPGCTHPHVPAIIVLDLPYPQPQSVDLSHSANRHICVTKSRILFFFSSRSPTRL